MIDVLIGLDSGGSAQDIAREIERRKIVFIFPKQGDAFGDEIAQPSQGIEAWYGVVRGAAAIV